MYLIALRISIAANLQTPTSVDVCHTSCLKYRAVLLCGLKKSVTCASKRLIPRFSATRVISRFTHCNGKTSVQGFYKKIVINEANKSQVKIKVSIFHNLICERGVRIGLSLLRVTTLLSYLDLKKYCLLLCEQSDDG